MLLQFSFTTCVTSKKLLQKTRRNNPRSGFPGFRYPLITVELPAIRNCQQSPSNASRPSNPSRKKKSGSYCWQLTLPSESVKIAIAILPLGTQPHFPAVLISITVFAQKKSLAATAGNFRCLASLLKLLSQFCH